MKKILLFFGVLTILAVVGFSINAQNRAQTQDQLNTAAQTAQNEMESAQNQEQIQTQNEQLGTDQEQIQNQIITQTQNEQLEAVQTQTVEKEGRSQIAQQRMSRVAQAVHEMLQIAERDEGIGQQVRIIAQSQNQEKIEMKLEKVQKRRNFVKFLLGPNHQEIKNAEKLLKQNREQIQELNQAELENSEDQQKLKEQIQVLETADQEIGDSLKKSKKGFSLLGWMFKLFAK